MPDVTDIEIYRDGGTIEFRVSGSAVDGLYRLQTPLLGTPEPLFWNGTKLVLASEEEAAILVVLQEWIAAAWTQEASAAICELDAMSEWRNLPGRLAGFVPLYYARWVARKLEERLPGRNRLCP